jgi:peroxiredoxin
MRRSNRWAIGLVAVCVVSAFAGCWSSAAPEKPGKSKASGGMAEKETKPSKPKPKEEPPPKPTIPKVALTDEVRATCKVLVGGTMPEAQLPDLQGKTAATKSLYGQKLTVMCFWAPGSSAAVQLMVGDMLEFLEKDIAEPYAKDGIRVVGVSVGDQPQAVSEALSQAGAKFPNLADAQGSFFAQVATEKLPRFYALDPQGKILWFDVPYSPSTRRLLNETIKAKLAGG